ncbi:MAG: hypothetical protein HWQ38_24355 [Nostoc sp. NMS7]|nr:hypothetical protein [Nostoc sp. NMS7]
MVAKLNYPTRRQRRRQRHQRKNQLDAIALKKIQGNMLWLFTTFGYSRLT